MFGNLYKKFLKGRDVFSQKTKRVSKRLKFRIICISRTWGIQKIDQTLKGK